MLNPVPMSFNLKSFEIIVDFKDKEGKMTLKLSEQKENSVDIVKLMVRDKNNFAIFRGSKTEDEENDMEFSASGTLIRDEDLVSFALMWIDKLVTEEHKDMVILNVGGRLFPFLFPVVPKDNPETEESDTDQVQGNKGSEAGGYSDLTGPFNDMLKNFADLMDHFLQ